MSRKRGVPQPVFKLRWAAEAVKAVLRLFQPFGESEPVRRRALLTAVCRFVPASARSGKVNIHIALGREYWSQCPRGVYLFCGNWHMLRVDSWCESVVQCSKRTDWTV